MSTATFQPIVIPDKYEIIPVHASDIANFMRCRRYWDWSSPTRTNLRRKVELHGIYPPLWFGNGIHYALEHYYNPVLQRDPVETFQTWFHLQWHGGHISTEEEELLDQVYDPYPSPVDTGWIVRGLDDLLPQADEEEFMGFLDLGVGMMTFYKDYAARNDEFEVVAAESKFSVPLEFTAVDTREESPNFGKKIEVHLRGKRDAIIYYPHRRDPAMQFEIMDHKTAAKVDEEYFLKLENDPQCTTYIVASVHEANVYDYPWKDIRGVLYNTLRKAYPKPPTITTRGFPSIDRQNESTTAKLFMETVRDIGLSDWFDDDAKAQGYYEYLIEQGDKVFIQRETAPRNPHAIKVAYKELQMVAQEMLDPNLKIYKHPSGMQYCTRCQFRVPCLAKDDGSDWKEMLVQGYEQNKGR